MTPAEDFFKVNPPSRLDFRSLRPPSRENFQNPIRRGGVDFFWNNPLQLTIDVVNGCDNDPSQHSPTVLSFLILPPAFLPNAMVRFLSHVAK